MASSSPIGPKARRWRSREGRGWLGKAKSVALIALVQNALETKHGIEQRYFASLRMAVSFFFVVVKRAPQDHMIAQM
jgi:hypothetical protein